MGSACGKGYSCGIWFDAIAKLLCAVVKVANEYRCGLLEPKRRCSCVPLRIPAVNIIFFCFERMQCYKEHFFLFLANAIFLS